MFATPEETWSRCELLIHQTQIHVATQGIAERLGARAQLLVHQAEVVQRVLNSNHCRFMQRVRAIAVHAMNAQVEAAARHVDLAVVVTTYMGHALFYGIEPLLQKPPIYPRSRGTVAFLEAIEAHARTESPMAH